MKPRRWVIFAICTSLFLVSLFYRASNAIIAPELSRDLKLDPHDLGLLGAAFFYAFALIQLPLGPILDRIGAKTTMIFLNLIGVLGTLVFASAQGLTGGVMGRALLGVGMAANLMGTLKLLTHWFSPRKFASLTGLALSLGTLGSLAATTPLALLVEALGWRGSFFALASLNLFLTICLFFFVQDRPSDRQVDVEASPDATASFPLAASIKRLFSSWSFWAISFSIFFRYGAFASIQALWAGPFLIQYLGLSPVTAGNLLLIISIAFIIGSPTGGMLSDRVFRTRKWIVFIASLITSAAVFALSRWQGTSFLPLLGTLFFILGFFASFNPISYAHIKELMPEEMSGTAMTGINFFTMIGAGIFIHGLGGVIKQVGGDAAGGGEAYGAAFLICSVALFMSAGLYFTTRDSRILIKRGKREDKLHIAT
ncbi:MAG: MFS transporter [Deltaproteobacteria bacterium]|nr:MFS transporter [Deltaproteobacteria bacterium]